PVPDAVDPARPQGGPPQRAQRQPGVRLLEEERLGALHDDQWPEGARHGFCLCQVPQPPGGAGPARTGGTGVCLWGRAEPWLVRLGPGDLPPALRDRAPLPPAGAGAHPHQHTGPAVAAVVRGGGPDPAQRLGLAALGGAVLSAPGRPAGRLGTADLPWHAAVAATLRGTVARSERRGPYTTPDPQMTYAIHCEAKIMESTEADSSLGCNRSLGPAQASPRLHWPHEAVQVKRGLPAA